jgi:hypothetical protein
MATRAPYKLPQAGSIPVASTSVTSKYYLLSGFYAPCFGVWRALSQYGDLHFGQTVGFPAPLGYHSCPHRSQT